MQPAPGRRRRWVIGLEAVTGVAAVSGGVLLVIRPDGSMIRAHLTALRGSPFATWRVPGLLLAGLVGGGMLLAAAVEGLRPSRGPVISASAGVGLIAFEIAEVAWIGPQPLEAVFALVGVVIVVLSSPRPRHRPMLTPRS